MRFVRATKIGTGTLSQRLGRKQCIRFNHSTFPVDPFGFNWVEPGTLCRQTEWQDAHSLVLSSDLLVVFANPGVHVFAHVPGGIIPDKKPGGLALFVQVSTTPVEKLGRDVTYRTSRNKAHPHLISHWIIPRALLPQHSIAGERFGIGIALFPGLLYQVGRLILALPGMQAWKRKPAPPDFIQKTNGPARLLACPRD